MAQRPALSAFRASGKGVPPNRHLGLLLALLLVLLAGMAGWILPQRSLLPLERALQGDARADRATERPS